jgi:flagellar hook-associated protein 1
MSGITSAINTALSGLELFEAGINTVSNNLANETTPGYSVESVNGQAIAGAPGQPGDGVSAPQITRAASAFAAAQLRGANSENQAASNQSTQLTNISNALTDNGDVQNTINQFFNDISTLAGNPSSAAQGETVLADAQSIIGTFQNAAGAINSSIADSSQTLQQSVSSANNLLDQLTTINKSLALAPNDPSLLDQQQGALNSLSGLISINAIPQTDGSVILTSGGTVLLDQSGAQTINVVNGNGSTPPSLTAGNNATLLTVGAADGAIGGSIATAQAGTAALQSLNTIASVFANAVNTAQAEGLTSSGVQGGPIFAVPPPSVTPSAANTGTATVTAQITNGSALPADGGPFLMTFNSTSGWSAVDQTTGQSYTGTGTPPSFAGLTLNVSGPPANGDQFVLNPVPNAATGISVTATSASDIAAADPYVATPGTLQSDGSIANNNGGTITDGTNTITSTPAAGTAVIPASFFGQNLQVTFTSPTAYTVSTAANPTTVISSGTLGAAGGNIAIAFPAGAASGQFFQLPVSGTPDPGDTLTLTPGGDSSGGNAARLAALFTAPGTTTSGTLQQSVVGLGTALGANAQAAQELATATRSQVNTATTNLQTVSGVDTDQQAVTLTNYQQAFQAAAQVISSVNTMFESLIQSV